MGTVTINPRTMKDPITCIGEMAGICYGADVTDHQKNYKRGIDCITHDHGRTLEFPDVYLILDGYSARVGREWYTHIGGSPTRLQESTRYIDYKNFDYITPPTIASNEDANKVWENLMRKIQADLSRLEQLGIPREDSANGLPLGMQTAIVGKYNARTLIDMSHQRLCNRAYWEFRDLFHDLMTALRNYSPEWKTLVDMTMNPKCELYGYCPETKSCGRRPKRD